MRLPASVFLEDVGEPLGGKYSIRPAEKGLRIGFYDPLPGRFIQDSELELQLTGDDQRFTFKLPFLASFLSLGSM